jgi:hypothetical protein
MDVEAAIRTALRSLSAVTALIGGSAAPRIYPDDFPETLKIANLPAVCVQVDTESRQNTLAGTASLTIADATLICRATTRDGSRLLAEAVKFNGTAPGTGLADYSGSEFICWLESQVQATTPADDGSSRAYYDTVLSLVMEYNEQP